MIDWFGFVIYEIYVLSEIGMIMVMDLCDVVVCFGSVGCLVCDVQVCILYDDGMLCDMGEIGLIYSCQFVYLDFIYCGNDEVCCKVECDGFVMLGDMGYFDVDGYLYVCDCVLDMVILGGVNIYLVEIEYVLLCYFDVVDCVVFGVLDDEYGECFVVVVQIECEDL